MFVGILLRDPARDFGMEFESLRHREIFEISARGQKTIGSHLNSERKVCGGCVQVHFAEERFSRAFHMEGCRRRLILGSIPTIRKIELEKQSSKRQHRKVSLVQFYLSFSIVSAMKFSFS